METRKKIRESLILQLKSNGTHISAYIDMVDDYMALYDIKTELIKDIQSRGSVIEETNSYGLKVKKDNTSVKQLHNTNKQMLSILKSLSVCENSDKEQDDDELMSFLKGSAKKVVNR